MVYIVTSEKHQVTSVNLTDAHSLFKINRFFPPCAVIKQQILTVGKALSDGCSRVRICATFPLDISFLDSSQETVVALISHT